MNDVQFDNHDPTASKWSNGALVCRTTQFWTGKFAGVIVGAMLSFLFGNWLLNRRSRECGFNNSPTHE